MNLNLTPSRRWRPRDAASRRWCLHDRQSVDAPRECTETVSRRGRSTQGLTQLDATIATGLLRGDAGAFLLGCRPDKPCQFCDPRRRRLFADTFRALSTPGRAPSDATTPSKHSEVRVTSPASLHRLLSSHRLSIRPTKRQFKRVEEDHHLGKLALPVLVRQDSDVSRVRRPGQG